MKKVIYIGIAICALGLGSCSKQDVTPNTADPVVPVWKVLDDGSDPVIVTDPTGTDITDPEIDITDPEIDN